MAVHVLPIKPLGKDPKQAEFFIDFGYFPVSNSGGHGFIKSLKVKDPYGYVQKSLIQVYDVSDINKAFNSRDVKLDSHTKQLTAMKEYIESTLGKQILDQLGKIHEQIKSDKVLIDKIKKLVYDEVKKDILSELKEEIISELKSELNSKKKMGKINRQFI
jgi:hypothetical protein